MMLSFEFLMIQVAFLQVCRSTFDNKDIYMKILRVQSVLYPRNNGTMAITWLHKLKKRGYKGSMFGTRLLCNT
jgi:hypothetical protein